MAPTNFILQVCNSKAANDGLEIVKKYGDIAAHAILGSIKCPEVDIMPLLRRIVKYVCLRTCIAISSLFWGYCSFL